MTPVRSVSWLRSVDTDDNRLPRLDMAVSCACRLVSSDFQGVSTFCRLLTIDATVELTSNPAPLVGDPKLNPTVPMHSSCTADMQPGNRCCDG
jgi:hypothetical protein